MLEFLLYHDVVEVYAGDAKFNNPEEMRLKHQKEAKVDGKNSLIITESEEISNPSFPLMRKGHLKKRNLQRRY